MKTSQITLHLKIINWLTDGPLRRTWGLYMVLWLFWSMPAYAYTPPIGIPDPGMWGNIHPIDTPTPDESLKCPNWPSVASPGCYYTEKNHPNATDTNNPYGYPDKPRKSGAPNPGPGFPAGTYMKYKGGLNGWGATYSKKQFTGTAENPCWMVGDKNDPPLFGVQLHFGDTSTYLIVDGLHFTGQSGSTSTSGIALNGNNSHHFCIRNCKFYDKIFHGPDSEVGINPVSGGGALHDVIVYNSEFSNLGNWQDTLDHDYHAIGISANGSGTSTYNVWVLNCSFSYIGGNGVQIISTENGDVRSWHHHIYMGKNIGHHNRQASFWSKQSSDVVMSQNIAYGGSTHGDQPGTGIGFQYGQNNLWIIFNEIYDCEYGIRQSSTPEHMADAEAYMIGNVIHDIPTVKNPYSAGAELSYYRGGQAFHFTGGVSSRYILNNTVYSANGVVNVTHAGPVEISNNVFSDIYSPDFFHANMSAQVVTTLDNNLFHDPEGATRFRWGNVYTSLSAFQTASGQCANCQVGDPLFVDPEGDNFNLQQTTPITTTKHIAYDTFYTLYGINIDVDYNGNPRPASGSWSVGAFEVGSLKSTSYPYGPPLGPKPTVDK